MRWPARDAAVRQQASGLARRWRALIVRRWRALIVHRWKALTGTAPAAAVALGLLACMCTVLAVAGPRAAAQLRTTAFRQYISAAPAAQKTVVGTVSDDVFSTGQQDGLSPAQIQLVSDELRRNLRGLPLAPAAADWSSLTTPLVGVSVAARSPALQATMPPKLELSYRGTLAANAAVVAGRLPAGPSQHRSAVILPVAATAPTAHRFGLDVGARLALPGTGIVLAVAGIVRPRDPAGPFWTTDKVVAAPQLVIVGQNDYWIGGFFIGAAGVSALQAGVNLTATQVSWMFPLSLDGLTAGQAGQLRPRLAGIVAAAGHLTATATPQKQCIATGGFKISRKPGRKFSFHPHEHCKQVRAQVPLTITMSAGTGQVIAGFQGAASSVGTVLGLLAVSLAVLAAAVVLLAGCLLAMQRREELALLRARGAGRRQVAILVLGGSAVTVVPAVAAGAAIGQALTPGVSAPLAWWLAALETLAALAGPVLVTVWVHRGYAAAVRPDQQPDRLASARRLIVEAALVLCAVGGLVVLREQGPGRGSTALYPSAAPALIAVAVAVLVLRGYPPLVRWLLRLTGRRTGATAYLGLVRAERVAASATLPAIALVLALGLVSFAGMLRGAVTRGEVTASWQQAGADAVVSSSRAEPAALARTVAALPGTTHVAAADVAVGTVASAPGFSVLLVDPAQYAAVLATGPLPRLPAAFTAPAPRPGSRASAAAKVVPVLASPGLAAQLGNRPAYVLLDGHQVVRVRVVGQAPAMSAVATTSGGYLVMNREVAAGGLGEVLLIAGPGLSRASLQAAVARQAPGAAMVVRSQLLDRLEAAPLRHGTYLGLLLGAVAAACCALLVLLLSLLLSAPSRLLTLARISAMGLTGAQARLLAVVELLPQLLAVLAGGLAVAVVLVPALGPALSLAVVTGSASSIPVRVEPAWLAATAIALLVLAIGILTGQTTVASRGLSRSLRIGG